MPISIAEYLGQRTDSDIQINHVHLKEYESEADLPKCPFNGLKCKKIAMKDYDKAPICAVRRSNGQYYIVCEHRLISTANIGLNNYRSQMLLRVARTIFSPSILPHQVEYKREKDVLVSQNLDPDAAPNDMFHSADFILSVPDMNIPVIGPRRVIAEIQGGGETSSTGAITSQANQWALDSQNNEFLRMPLSKPGTIQTNAWRRLQEQILGKGSTAAKTGYGFVAVVGDVVADYIIRIMPGLVAQKLNPMTDSWNLAFVVFREVASENSQIANPLIPGAVELDVDNSRTIFTTMDRFIEAIKTRGVNFPNVFEHPSFKSIEEVDHSETPAKVIKGRTKR